MKALLLLMAATLAGCRHKCPVPQPPKGAELTIGAYTGGALVTLPDGRFRYYMNEGTRYNLGATTHPFDWSEFASIYFIAPRKSVVVYTKDGRRVEISREEIERRSK